MKVLDRKLRRDLRGTRTTLASVLLVVVLGVSCFVGMASAFSNLEQSQREYYAACRMADFWVHLRKAPRSELERILELEGVAEVRPRIVFDTIIDLDDVAKPLSGQVLSLPEQPRPVINDIVLRRGTYFTGERLEEVIINEAFARARDIRPGETIHVILNNRRQRLFVVGTALSSEFAYLMQPGSLIPEPENYGILYVTERFAEEALDFEGACNQVVGLLTPATREHPQHTLDAIEQRLDDYGVITAIPRSQQLSHQILHDEIKNLRITAIFIPMIFLGVAALILNILMSRIVEQQRSVIGTLKALGYGNRILTWHYLKYGMLVGVGGGALGIALGAAFTHGMMLIYRHYFEFPRLEHRVTPYVYVIGMLFSIVFALLGTVRGVRAVVRLSPAEAMRAQPPVAGGAIGLERFRRLWRTLGFRGQMAARSVWRHKLRTAVGMTAAAFGSAIMLLSFYFKDAIDYTIDFQFDKVLVSDFDLTLKDERDLGALDDARRLPGVDRAEPLLHVPCEFRHGHRAKRSGVVGVTRGARLTVPRRADGTPIDLPATGLVMSRKLADLLQLRAGDRVIMEPVRGRREPRRVPIARIADSFFGMTTYADFEYLNRVIGEEAAVSALQLETSNDPQVLLVLYRELKELPAVQAISDNGQMKANLVHAFVENMRISLVIMIAFAGAIYFASILTTSLVALAERQREVATLVVVGYEKWQVGGIFLRESLLVNLLGSAVGLPLGVLLVLALIEQYDTEIYRMPLIFTPGSFVLTMVLALAFTAAAHLVVQRAINRMAWQEALNAKE